MVRVARALVALALFALGCGGLPEYAAPQGALVPKDSLDDSDLIAYRPLVREDFRGNKPPPEFAAVADRVGAATCARVITTPDTQLSITGIDASYQATVRTLWFRALMDRTCSWWNDKVAAFSPSYVLQHEQIHFALFELGARRLNASIANLRERVQGSGSTPEEAAAEAEEELNAALEDAMDDILEENRDFDEDTSLGHEPARQQAWWDKVQRRLAETARFATPPGS
jgi:hypothetical protein